MKLLQVCNVGNIVGGTAACAWTITRALPEYTHEVLFLSPITRETHRAFTTARILCADRLTSSHLTSSRPDLLLLHNTSPHRIDSPLPSTTRLYLHSETTPIPGLPTVCCSHWLTGRLAARMPALSPLPVLWQGVPRALRLHPHARPQGHLIVGRICTPTSRKWPPSLLDFYTQLARQHPHIHWEFVGCPPQLTSALRALLGQRVTFHAPGWHARSLLWRWHVLLQHQPGLTESFGRTVAEALRTGCIPLVDHAGGFLEQLEPLDSSLLCRTTDDFSHALSRLTNVATRAELSRRCHLHGEAHFSITRFRQRLLPWLAS